MSSAGALVEQYVEGLREQSSRVLWDRLQYRPTINIPVPTTTADILLSGRPVILAGWSLEETTGGGAVTTSYVTAATANAAAANNPVLPAGGAGVTTWVTGFEVTGAGATAGSVIAVTLTGTISGTLRYQLVIPTGATVGVTPLLVSFPPPGIPASAQNLAITLNVPSFGAGNLNAAATVHGYQQNPGPAAGAAVSAATARALLFNGRDSGGVRVAGLALPLGTMSTVGTNVLCYGGLFLNLVAGSIAGSVWVKV